MSQDRPYLKIDWASRSAVPQDRLCPMIDWARKPPTLAASKRLVVASRTCWSTLVPAPLSLSMSDSQLPLVADLCSCGVRLASMNALATIAPLESPEPGGREEIGIERS